MSLESTAARLQSTALSEILQATPWVVPAMQTIHILMIGVVFVSILMIALRVLGWARTDDPLDVVWRRFAPFLWTALVLMAITGALLTIAEPVREVMTLSFRIKLLLLVIGIGSALVFGRSVRAAAAAGCEQVFSPLLRVACLATIVLWVAIIFLGRAIAYDDWVWGNWSPAKLLHGEAT